MIARNWFGMAVLAIGLLLPSGVAWAQRDRDREPAEPPREARDGDGDRDRGGSATPRPDREDEQGTEEGMPELGKVAPRAQVAPGVEPRVRPGWRLGVFAVNTDTGVRITRVMPGTPAERNGLEPGDTIVTVNGYQVGYVMGGFYPLGAEMQRRASPNGEVTFLVQDRRTDRLLNIPVRLEQRGIMLPRP